MVDIYLCITIKCVFFTCLQNNCVCKPVAGVEAAVAPLRLMIFSSMSARTDTDAVCRGGPVDSFLSSFLLSESCKIYVVTNLGCFYCCRVTKNFYKTDCICTFIFICHLFEVSSM